MSFEKITNILNSMASNSEFLTVFKDDPEKLDLEFNSRELSALKSADMLMGSKDVLNGSMTFTTGSTITGKPPQPESG